MVYNNRAVVVDNNKNRDSITTRNDPSKQQQQDVLDSDSESQSLLNRQRVTPIPKGQLTALCCVRIVDPIAFSQIFPYVNEFMSHLHVTDDPSKIGFYSGLAESAFALAQLLTIYQCAFAIAQLLTIYQCAFAIAQLLTIYQCARLSDVIGRKPVILTGIIGVSSATFCVGLSTSFYGVVLDRSIAGLFSGNTAVVHSVLAEITDSTNQAKAYPIYGLLWPLGTVIGPLIGGLFSRPADRFPQWLDYAFLRQYPFFLPGFIAAMVGFFSVTVGYFFLEETLPSKIHVRNTRLAPKRAPQIYQAASDASTSTSEQPPLSEQRTSFRALLRDPVMFALSTSGFLFAFVSSAFDVVFVLFCYTSVEHGGLGLSTAQIGYCLSSAGYISAIMQLFFMPYILRTFDHAETYSFNMSLWGPTFAALPILNFIVRTGKQSNASVATMWIGVVITLGLSRVACLVYTLSIILVKENAPNAAVLGSANGLVQFCMSSSRAFAPAFISTVFTLSRRYNIFGGHFWVLVMVGISFVGWSVSRKIEVHART